MVKQKHSDNEDDIDRIHAPLANLDMDAFPTMMHEDIGDVDQLLAKEMNNLSAMECDIHGIIQVQDEDPDNAKELLVELENQLESIRKDKEAFEQAKYLNPDYVKDPKFCLMRMSCHDQLVFWFLL
jgi:hypothetical protein